MAVIMPDEGKIEALRRLLYAGVESLTLKLFKTNVTPGNATTASDFTVADFTGYSNTTLTATQSGSTWAVPTTSSNVASSIYGSAAVTWTATSDQDIYGWFIVGATSGKVYLAEKFASPKSLIGANSDQLSFTPKIKMQGI